MTIQEKIENLKIQPGTKFEDLAPEQKSVFDEAASEINDIVKNGHEGNVSPSKDSVELQKIIDERLAKIMVYLHQTEGIPVELQIDEIKKYPSMLHVLIFVNEFAKSHPKVIQPINYSEVKNK